MRKLMLFLVMVCVLAVPVEAMEFKAPAAPEGALEYLPENTENFGEGLLEVLNKAVSDLYPELAEAGSVCLSLIVTVLLISMVSDLSETAKTAIQLTGAAIIAITLFQPINSFIKLGAETVTQVSQYGKLMLPVLTSAMAAQGGVTKSGALYAATAFFDSLLSNAISVILVPLVYIFLSLAVAVHLFPQKIISNTLHFIKWLITWCLKTILYIFTGYISITGVIGGTTDATLLKATKLTVSGMVPVVGGILSDASEAVLVSAGLMKNAIGIYGLLTIIALWIGPFLEIGIQYLMLKITSGICEMFGTKQMTGVIQSFSTAMGFLLAMTGAICVIFVISTICFMKGVN